MTKILKIEDNIVIVGMDDGTTAEIPKTQFPFEINEFMAIHIYKYNDTYLVSKSENPTSFNPREDEPPVEGKIYVDKKTYGLLRLLVGTFGVHHFYAGNTKKAILTLCVSFLPLIILGIAFSLAGTIDHHTGGESRTYAIIFVALFIISLIGLIIFHIYLFITAIIILCKDANRNGKILISTGRK